MKLIPLSMGDLIHRCLTRCLQLCDTFGNSGVLTLSVRITCTRLRLAPSLTRQRESALAKRPPGPHNPVRGSTSGPK